MAQHTTNFNLEKQQGNDLVNINGINNNFDTIDAELKEAQSRIQKAVGTLVELKAVTGVPDNTTILCEGLGLYRYDASSTATSDDFFIVAPTIGGGRWILMAETAIGFSMDTGSTNVFVLTLPGLTAYYTGMMVWFKAVNANIGACTINVNSLGVKSLIRSGGIGLVTGDITVGDLICAVYDGTNFQLISLLATNLVHLTAAQTLTNKTLTSPILTTPKFASAGSVVDANGNELIKFPTTVASAVNEITVYNAATGMPPNIQSSGSDTNIGLDFKSKGTGIIRHYVNNVISTVFDAVASAVNYLALKSNVLGSEPTIEATGIDTNIDINIVPKGNGRLKENGTAIIRRGDDYRPNLLFNSDFQIWSKGDSFTNPSFAYTADKWYSGWDGTGGTNVISKQSGSPTSQSKFLRFQCSALSTGGTYKLIENRAADINLISDCTITVSAWLKGDSSQTISLNLYQVFGTGGSAAVGYYSESKIVTTSWAMYSWTLKLSSIIGKTIGTDSYFCTQFVLPYNSTFTIDIANVKLEINDHATPFIPKAYKEELLNCSDNLGYAPNLLINGDFKIWQRGTTFNRTGISGIFYAADRWACYRGNAIAGLIVNKIENGITLNNPDATQAVFLSQTLPSSEVIALRGKIVTLSIKIKSTVTNICALQISYSNTGEISHGGAITGTIASKFITVGTDFAIYSITATIPNDAVGLNPYIYMSEGSATSTFEYVKLEVNDHATPYIPRTTPEELALCQRYYRRYQGSATGWITFGDGQAISSTLANILMTFDVQMRTTPTFSYGGNLALVSNTSSALPVTLTIISANAKNITIRGTVSNGLVGGDATQLLSNNDSTAYIAFDAEI